MMCMLVVNLILLQGLLINDFGMIPVLACNGIRWDKISCSTDTDPTMPEGIAPDIGRFPWLGIVQHSFYLGGAERFAITGGVLIHPSFVIAPAEDIARIDPEALLNNTKFVAWRTATDKVIQDVVDYYIHPEYENVTFATIALLELLNVRDMNVAPLSPICLPIRGGGVFMDMYVVKMTDENVELAKEVSKVDLVGNQDCEEFYYNAKLNYKKMGPISPLCAKSSVRTDACIWDGGYVLITKQDWGFWKLLGFGFRGPGCGAPARFASVHKYLMWIDDVITRVPLHERVFDEEKLVFRRVSPFKLLMYKGKIRLPRDYGQCDRRQRGSVLYKDTTEVLTTKNFAQGFFFLAMAQVAELSCATVFLEVTARSNAAIWVEHHCQADLAGAYGGYSEPRDDRPRECWVYFQSVAYIEFRFFFSFKASLEVAMYGSAEVPKIVPNPHQLTESTYPWVPTHSTFQSNSFVPLYSWYWYM